jgi:hypothetical protein
MDVLEYLHMVNIQRHSNTKLEFSPHFNTIRGKTDSGKSSIVRCLRWLLFNKPTNLNVLKRGTKKSVATIAIDGHTISRLRTKTKNHYILDGNVKKAFGKGVPNDIQTLINMNELLHNQKQADPYFMLGVQSPTERAKLLERFSDLLVISSSMTNARKYTNYIKGNLDTVKGVLDRYKALLSRVVDFLPSNDRIISLFSDYDLLEGRRHRYECLSKNYGIIRTLRSILKTCRSLCLTKQVESLKKDIAELGKRKSLQKLLMEALSIETSLVSAKTISIPTSLEEDLDSFANMRNKYDAISTAVSQIEAIEKEMAEKNDKINEMKRELETMPVCKTCGRPL